ncbi:MAG: serine hydrolase domain-containing protein, partial [Salinibacter sp.]
LSPMRPFSSRTPRWLLALCLLLAVSGAAKAQPISESRLQRAVDVLETFMDTSRVPGLSGAIAVDGEVRWTGGFGYANLQHRVPATDSTRYRIASISKPIAATVAMTLVEEGRLNLGKPIRSYLPLFPKKRGRITTRQLLSHTAGIRHYRDDEFLSDTRYESRLGPVSIFADDSLLFEPGTQFSYSTYGYTLASAVMEAAADSTFLKLLEARIRKPLGLESIVPEKTEQVIPNEASFYLVKTSNGDTTVVNAPYVDNSNKWTGGGLLATPADLTRFVSALLNGRILPENRVQQMFSTQAEIEDESYHYGLGWFVGTDDQGRRRVWHTGGAVGGSGVVLFYPERELIIATLANASDVPHLDLADRMATLLLGDEP